MNFKACVLRLTPCVGYVLLTFADAVAAERAARSHLDAHVATFEDFNRESVYGNKHDAYASFCDPANCQDSKEAGSET